MKLLDTVTCTGAALGDRTRLRLLLLLERGPMTVGRLAERLDVVPSVASFHVAKLEAAGLVVTRRPGRVTIVRRRQDRWRRLMQAFVE